MGIAIALSGFGWFHIREQANRLAVSSVLLSAMLCLLMFATVSENKWLADQLAPDGQVIVQETWQGKFIVKQSRGDFDG